MDSDLDLASDSVLDSASDSVSNSGGVVGVLLEQAEELRGLGPLEIYSEC